MSRSNSEALSWAIWHAVAGIAFYAVMSGAHACDSAAEPEVDADHHLGACVELVIDRSSLVDRGRHVEVW